MINKKYFYIILVFICAFFIFSKSKNLLIMSVPEPATEVKPQPHSYSQRDLNPKRQTQSVGVSMEKDSSGPALSAIYGRKVNRLVANQQTKLKSESARALEDISRVQISDTPYLLLDDLHASFSSNLNMSKVLVFNGIAFYKNPGSKAKNNVFYNSHLGKYGMWTGEIAIKVHDELLFQKILNSFEVNLVSQSDGLVFVAAMPKFNPDTDVPAMMSLLGADNVSLDLKYAKLNHQ